MTISPHTPPGTHIVCVNNEHAEDMLTIGQVYVLSQIIEMHNWFGDSIFAVEVAGIMCNKCGSHPQLFIREAFDLAVLPKAITELLTEQPVDA